MSLDANADRTTRLEVGQYLGRVERQASLGVGLVTETSYLADSTIPRHAHRLASLSVIVEGSCLERTETGDRECRPGSVVYHPTGMPHALTFASGGGRCVNVELHSEGMTRLGFRLPPGSRSRYSSRPVEPTVLRRLHEELASEDPWTDMAVTSLVLEILVALMRVPERPSGSPPRWMRSALSQLDSQRSPPSLETMGRELEIHPSSLARSFRRHQGMTIGEYSRRVRLRRVCRRLAETAETIAMIAAAEGFSDQSHLTRVMRRVMGITPAEYRRRC